MARPTPDRDTIVAGAGPPGGGLTAIVRLSGPRAFELVEGLFDPSLQDPKPTAGWSCSLGTLAIGPAHGRLPAMLYRMPAPASYTREDVAELHFPGAVPLLEKVLQELTAAGARPAEPGEFTRRAWRHGRIDLVQAEAVMKLIRAEDDSRRRAALSELSGRLSGQLETIRQSLLSAKVYVEGAIDFFEDDAALEDIRQVRHVVREALEQLEPMVDRDAADFHAGLPSVVLVGRPNAGKSSVFNRLSADHRAVVTERPGTTRDYLEGTFEVDGLHARIFDTAGRLEPDADEVMADSMAHLEHLLAGADVVALVLDATELGGGPVDLRAASQAQLPDGVTADLLILNKVDLLPGAARLRLDGQHDTRVVSCSALTGAGLDDLRCRLGDALSPCARGSRAELNLRQRTLVRGAVDRLRRADRLLAEGNLLELVSVELNDAAEGLATLGCPIAPDDVLEEIFAGFCIGK